MGSQKVRHDWASIHTRHDSKCLRDHSKKKTCVSYLTLFWFITDKMQKNNNITALSNRKIHRQHMMEGKRICTQEKTVKSFMKKSERILKQDKWSPWCHPTIVSSVIPFYSCLQSFPVSGAFLTSQLFTSDGQSIGVSASASVLPMNIQDWFPLGWTGLISLQFKGLSRVVSNTTVQKHQFFSSQLSL